MYQHDTDDDYNGRPKSVPDNPPQDREHPAYKGQYAHHNQNKAQDRHCLGLVYRRKSIPVNKGFAILVANRPFRYYNGTYKVDEQARSKGGQR